MNKLNAFTLMELLIGMLISSLVISFCYFAFNVVSNNFFVFKKDKQVLWNAIQFQSALSENCFSTKSVIYKNDKLEILDSKNESWNYYFFDSLVLREHRNIVDSFFIKVGSIDVRDFATANGDEDNLIEGMEIESNVNGLPYKIFVESNCALEIFVKNEVSKLSKN